MKQSKLLKIILLILIIFSIGQTVNAETIAILPLKKENNIEDREYLAFYKYFYDSIKNHYNANLISHESINKTINELGLENKNLTLQEVMLIGKNLNVDKIIYGSVGINSFFANNQRFERCYSTCFLIDPGKEIILNSVSWNVPLNSNIMVFGESLAKRLIYLSPEDYPVIVSIDSNRKKKISENYYRDNLRKFFPTLNFPRTTEIKNIEITIKEKKELAPTGCIGCITLIGWIFLPYWYTETKIEITVDVKYLSSTGLREKKYSDESYIKEYFHLMRDDKIIYRNTELEFEKVKKNIYQKILNDKELFIDPENNI